MAGGYLHITKDDIIFGEDNIVYWKNGGRILGEVVSCIDGNDDVHYYLKTTNIKKAILIDAFVPVGVNDYFLYSDSANFINVQINEEDFSGDGGGAGISVTFLLPEGKYYTCKYIEPNGDIRIYDPLGDGGEIGGSGLPDTSAASAGDVLALDADKMPVWTAGGKKYEHLIRCIETTSNYYGQYCFRLINNSPDPLDTAAKINAEINSYTAQNPNIPVSGYHWVAGFTGNIIFLPVSITKSDNDNNLRFNGIQWNVTTPAQSTYNAQENIAPDTIIESVHEI